MDLALPPNIINNEEEYKVEGYWKQDRETQFFRTLEGV